MNPTLSKLLLVGLGQIAACRELDERVLGSIGNVGCFLPEPHPLTTTIRALGYACAESGSQMRFKQFPSGLRSGERHMNGSESFAVTSGDN